MVPLVRQSARADSNFPRIRGDGPVGSRGFVQLGEFSPYSRGWSRPRRIFRLMMLIFPVFAGMVLASCTSRISHADFPRIRGDGPGTVVSDNIISKFSPYSRGWSRTAQVIAYKVPIFPVFAGMVPAGNTAG